MITIAEYISKFLSSKELKQCFLVPGGGAMFLNEAFRKNTKINVLPMHHEQACSMAAEGYTKLNNLPAIVSVTTGPGAINSLNGVYGAYMDSIPMFVVSGQVKRETYSPLVNRKLRQLGDQEVNIIDMVRGITKYSKTLIDIKELDQTLEDAYKLMLEGRKGPVWIDIPIDLQSSYVEEKKFKYSVQKIEEKNIDSDLKKFKELFNSSNKPVIIAGSGVRISDSFNLFNNFVKKLSIPVTTTFNGHDLISSDSKYFVGRQGTIGDRSGNFAVQNADLLIILGTRLNIRQVGYNFKSFSPYSKKIMIDIDEEELNKKTLDIDLKINADLNYFFRKVDSINLTKKNEHSIFLTKTKNLQNKYPVIQNKFYKSKLINPYILMELVHECSNNRDIIVTSDGSAAVMSSQSLKLKKGQRLFSNSGSASMGYGLPASIGAAKAAKKNQKVICIEGDGSIHMNIQELETIKFNNLNIKIIIIENNGYLSIKQTQKKFFNKMIAAGPESGLGIPDFVKICNAYGLKTSHTKNIEDTRNKFNEHFNKTEPHVFIVSVDQNQEFEPKPSSKRLEDGTLVSLPLDNLAPFLDQKELDEIKNQFDF